MSFSQQNIYIHILYIISINISITSLPIKPVSVIFITTNYHLHTIQKQRNWSLNLALVQPSTFIMHPIK